jgi:aryl-alcohol dehydrogenase-like predicted oxidoreductase
MSKLFFNVYAPGTEVHAAEQGVNDGSQVNQVGLSRKHVMDAIDASVKRLGTYIDILQTHRMDSEAPKEEIMKALNDIVESGKARYIGGSTVGGSPENNFLD